MNGQDDGVQAFALAVVAGIVGLVLAGVLALVCARSILREQGEPAVGPVQRIYFAAGEERLALEADAVLARAVEAARGDAQALLLITGIVDARGDDALARRRALRVRHALEANGVPPAQLVLGKPRRSAGPARESSRVDVQLQ